MKRAAAILVLAWALLPQAQAQATDDGRLLASGCFQCHGTAGVNGGFGSIAGIGKADMLNKLNDFRRKAAGSNIMAPHARGYTHEQLALIADYFARQPKP